MHYLKVTALATALAALASTSPIPDRSAVEGAACAVSDSAPYRRDRVILEGAESSDPDFAYCKEKRDRAIVEGAEGWDKQERPYRKEKRDRAVVEGAEDWDEEEPSRYRKEKRGTYSRYENNGPYVPMSDEMEA